MKTSVLIITISLLVAAFFRIVLPWNNTFVDNEVRFSQVDSYYSMDAVDMMRKGTFSVNQHPQPHILSEQIVYGISYIVSLGNLTKNTTDTIAALFTAICGLLAVLFIYFVTRELFNNEKIALLSIALAALMPGEFLSRTSLGFFDHHALEIVLFLLSTLFFIRMIKRHSLLNAFIAGIVASLYMCNWMGGIILYGLYVTFAVFYIIVFGNNKNNATMIGNILLCTCTSLLIYMIYLLSVLYPSNMSSMPSYLPYIILSTALLPVLLVLRRLFQSIKTFLFVVIVPSIVLVFGLIIAFVPLEYVTIAINRIIWDTQTATSEGMPLLFPGGQFTLLPVWVNFGILFPIFLFGLGIVLRQKITTARLFFLCWSIIILVLTLGGVRFAEYLAVNVAIISSFTIVYVCQRIKAPAKRLKRLILYTVFAGIIVFVPLVSYSSLISKQSPEYFTDSWHDAMIWIDKNTDQDDIILSLWDYGYWIKREGNRKPFCDPGRPNNRAITASLLLNSPEQSAIDMQALDIGYIIIDSLMVEEKYYVYAAHNKSTDHVEIEFDVTVLSLYYGINITGFEKVFGSSEVVIYKVK